MSRVNRRRKFLLKLISGKLSIQAFFIQVVGTEAKFCPPICPPTHLSLTWILLDNAGQCNSYDVVKFIYYWNGWRLLDGKKRIFTFMGCRWSEVQILSPRPIKTNAWILLT